MTDTPLTQQLLGHVADRGRARYFHGRGFHLDHFSNVLADAQAGNWGTTFLIQGPPGAGKTALMHELADNAERDGWVVSRLNTLCLVDPAVLTRQLGVKYVTSTSRQLEGSLKVVGAGRTRTVADSPTPAEILSLADKSKNGLLLLLDEAQGLMDVRARESAKATLDPIHNGLVGQPVMLLAGGLGQTRKAFASLDISRFWKGCVIDIGRLEPDASRAVIHDWLEKSGGAHGDVAPWVEAIAQEADDWPHHIVNYASPAAKWLQQHGGQLTDAGLEHVLAVGRQGKEEYYKSRATEIGYKDQALLGAMIQTLGQRRQWDRVDLVDAFGLLKRVPSKSAEGVVDLALAKGILAGDEDLFRIPIPSMEDWLVGRYKNLQQDRPAVYREIQAALRSLLH